MHARATGTFENKGWNEQPISQAGETPKVTRASATNVYSGELEGSGLAEYLMVYREDGTAVFVGLERINGRLGGRAGSFVVQHTGTDEGGMTKSTMLVVPRSATGELRGLRGEGSFAARHTAIVPYTLDYDID